MCFDDHDGCMEQLCTPRRRACEQVNGVRTARNTDQAWTCLAPVPVTRGGHGSRAELEPAYVQAAPLMRETE